MFAYFGAAGALDELLRSAFVLGSYQVRVEQSELVALTKSIWLGFPLASPLVAIGVLAFAVRAASEVRTLKSSQWGSTPLVPLGLILVLFFVWSMIDYQGYPDFFPFLPYAALGIVVAADKFVAWLGARGAKLAGVLAIAALMILPGLNVALANKLSRQSPVWHDGLQKQRRAYAQVVDPARADCRDMCRIVVIGLPEVPALLGFKALSRFILNDWGGTDAFIASGYANGFQGWLDELQAAKPDLVVAKTTEFDNYSAANHRLVMDWLGSRCFEKVAHDDIETKEFRSDHIASWRARPECR
jgi:hypothetical protein